MYHPSALLHKNPAKRLYSPGIAQPRPPLRPSTTPAAPNAIAAVRRDISRALARRQAMAVVVAVTSLHSAVVRKRHGMFSLCSYATSGLILHKSATLAAESDT